MEPVTRDWGTGWRGRDTMGLMLTRGRPGLVTMLSGATPLPLATPSDRMIWVPGVMGVLAGGTLLYTLFMSPTLIIVEMLAGTIWEKLSLPVSRLEQDRSAGGDILLGSVDDVGHRWDRRGCGQSDPAQADNPCSWHSSQWPGTLLRTDHGELGCRYDQTGRGLHGAGHDQLATSGHVDGLGVAVGCQVESCVPVGWHIESGVAIGQDLSWLQWSSIAGHKLTPSSQLQRLPWDRYSECAEWSIIRSNRLPGAKLVNCRPPEVSLSVWPPGPPSCILESEVLRSGMLMVVPWSGLEPGAAKMISWGVGLHSLAIQELLLSTVSWLSKFSPWERLWCHHAWHRHMVGAAGRTPAAGQVRGPEAGNSPLSPPSECLLH